MIQSSSSRVAFLLSGESRLTTAWEDEQTRNQRQVHDARHAKTRRKAKNEKNSEHFVDSVIHACEESNRRHSYIKGKRIKKEGISLKESSIKKNDIKIAVARASRHSRNWRKRSSSRVDASIRRKADLVWVSPIPGRFGEIRTEFVIVKMAPPVDVAMTLCLLCGVDFLSHTQS
jgi:hypothetical protein